MVTEPLSCPIGSPHEFRLQLEFGTQARAQAFYRHQVLGSLNSEMVSFIEQQRMVFVASSDATGSADCSPRFGPQGFVRILRDGSLCWPEYRGNGVLATLSNIKDNPHVALLFVDFERAKIGLHVNGQAWVRSNDQMVPDPYSTPLLEADTAIRAGRHPECWVLMEVDEAYIHCSKHIPLMRVLTQDEEVHWGTDDTQQKGGDYFRARRSGARAP
jgi:predicted pyridoxine 5'-phosphate oxidase superfamily flavin-nucleotide-binding protein